MKQLKLQELIEQAKLIQPEEWVELALLIEQSSFAQRSFCDCSWETIPEQIKYLLITHLKISKTQLNNLPESIGKLSNLIDLDLSQNQLTNLPESINNLAHLSILRLSGDFLVDISILQRLHNVLRYHRSATVNYLNINFTINSRDNRYLTQTSKWKPEWLLDESNTEIRRVLIEQLGYEKICEKLNSVNLDTWREYTLLRIDGAGVVYSQDDEVLYYDT